MNSTDAKGPLEKALEERINSLSLEKWDKIDLQGKIKLEYPRLDLISEVKLRNFSDKKEIINFYFKADYYVSSTDFLKMAEVLVNELFLEYPIILKNDKSSFAYIPKSIKQKKLPRGLNKAKKYENFSEMIKATQDYKTDKDIKLAFFFPMEIYEKIYLVEFSRYGLEISIKGTKEELLNLYASALDKTFRAV